MNHQPEPVEPPDAGIEPAVPRLPAAGQDLDVALALDVDLVAALAAMSDVAKNRTADAGQYSYSYASLADILGVVRSILAEHRLAVTQRVTTDYEAGSITISTTLLHTSGDHYDGGSMTWPMPNTAQAAGSLISYSRRYQLLAVLGIAGADDDDDGAQATNLTGSATARTTHRRRRVPDPDDCAAPTQATGLLASGAQLRALATAFGACDITERADRLAFVSAVIGREVATSKQLTRAEASAVIDKLGRLEAGALAIVLDEDGTWSLNEIEPAQ